MAENLELPYFRSVGHMGPNAGAVIIVTDTHQTKGLGRISGKLAQIHNPGSLFP